jgi:nicotinate-nucleotide pyrophosphorylase (carboxylating)
MTDWSHPEILDVVRRALAEDIGSGDVTSAACVPPDRQARGRFLAREPLVLAGIELLPLVFSAASSQQPDVAQALSLPRPDSSGRPSANFIGAARGATFIGTGGAGFSLPASAPSVYVLKTSGYRATEHEILATVSGNARLLLACERTALNFLQHLSGIATLASRYVDAVAGTKCKILDTRKTTPGLRRLEKLAAAAGGVTNHRLGLWDAILIKNNHIAAAGGVAPALEAAKQSGLPVEIEVRTKAELGEALDHGAKHLLLDNLTPAQAREWIALIGGRATVELSGGITLETVRDYAETGADFVSCGAITHSARAVDLSFRLEL